MKAAFGGRQDGDGVRVGALTQSDLREQIEERQRPDLQLAVLRAAHTESRERVDRQSARTLTVRQEALHNGAASAGRERVGRGHENVERSAAHRAQVEHRELSFASAHEEHRTRLAVPESDRRGAQAARRLALRPAARADQHVVLVSQPHAECTRATRVLQRVPDGHVEGVVRNVVREPAGSSASTAQLIARANVLFLVGSGSGEQRTAAGEKREVCHRLRVALESLLMQIHYAGM